jgi:hypothetical protein
VRIDPAINVFLPDLTSELVLKFVSIFRFPQQRPTLISSSG